MIIDVRCPSCNDEFKLPEQFAGGVYRCPSCNVLMTVQAKQQKEDTEESSEFSNNDMFNDLAADVASHEQSSTHSKTRSKPDSSNQESDPFDLFEAEWTQQEQGQDEPDDNPFYDQTVETNVQPSSDKQIHQTSTSRVKYKEHRPLERIEGRVAFTIQFMFKARQNGIVLAVADDQFKHRQLVIRMRQQNGHLVVSIAGKKLLHLSSRQNLCDDKWHHLILTRHTSHFQLYIDGSLTARQPTHAKVFSEGIPCWIGGHPKQSTLNLGSFHGRIRGFTVKRGGIKPQRAYQLAEKQLKEATINTQK